MAAEMALFVDSHTKYPGQIPKIIISYFQKRLLQKKKSILTTFELFSRFPSLLYSMIAAFGEKRKEM